ncbi:MAG: MFS transporter, partial [Ancalomicrobiaceae bacterium]|nr:MFS transporter [Ancalomicrobiaceae bacterium]
RPRGLPEVARCLSLLNGAVVRLDQRYRRIAAAIVAAGGRLSGAASDLGGIAGRFAEGSAPREIRTAAASHLRLPLFLFFLATELSRSFLPIFADAIYQPLPGFERSVVVALPMTVYVLASLLSTPLAGMLVSRYGTANAYLLGMAPTIVGLLGEAFSTTIPVLAAFRVVEGAGFAIVSIAALDHIRQTSSSGSLAKGAVVYGAAYIAGGICGTSTGAILADRAGFAGAFFIAVVIAVIATQLSFGAFRDAFGSGREQPVRTEAPVRGRWLDLRPFKSLRFVSASIFLAWPAQMVVTGFVYYATPLLLHEEGFSTSMIGRIVMTYFLTSLIASRLAARWADSGGRHRGFAAAGLALSGIGALVPIAAGGGGLWLILAVVLMGLAQAIGGPSRGAIMLEECAQLRGVPNSVALGVYRVLERLGALAGPLFVAALVPAWGYRSSIFILGLTVLTATLLYAALTRLAGGPGDPNPQEASA